MGESVVQIDVPTFIEWAVIYGACIAVGITIAVGGFLLVISYAPRLHAGQPEEKATLVVTARNPLAVKGIPQEPRVIRRLDILWWFGLSHRPRAKWFIGILRWDEAKD